MDLHSGYPFWLIKDGLPFEYPKLQHSIQADVVILGGGISGALTAYHLTNAGINCVLIDARTIGLGSTCASTSLLQYEIDTPLCKLKEIVGYKNAVTCYKLCEEAINKIHEITRLLGFKDFNFKKSLYYAAKATDVNLLKQEFEIRKQNNFCVDLLTENDIRSDYNFSAPAAILSRAGAHINAYTFTHSLLQYSLQNGLEVYDRTPVKKIKHTKDRITLTTENNCTIKAKQLVYATGYEVVNFINKKIVALHSTYATISEQHNNETEFWKDDVMMWNTARPYLYLRSVDNKRILVGGRDENFQNEKKRDKLIKRKSKLLAADFNTIFPGISFKAEFSWAGTFGETKDGLPFIGSYKRLPNSFFALGFGGNGITFSLIAAEIITDLIKGNKNPNAKIFSFERV